MPLTAAEYTFASIFQKAIQEESGLLKEETPKTPLFFKKGKKTSSGEPTASQIQKSARARKSISRNQSKSKKPSKSAQ